MFNSKHKTIILFVSIIVPLVIIVCLLIVFKRIKSVDSILHYKYNVDKKVGELNLNTIEDYVEYLSELKEQIKPHEIQSFVEIDNSRAKVYKDADMTQGQTGVEIMKELSSSAYNKIILLVVRKNQNWKDLPLTDKFRSKFNESDGCIKEFDFTGKTIVASYRRSFDDKKFSVERSWIPDDAHEKYTDDEIEYMLEYGAGAYNLDRYNYEFVLDKDGYLDDIIFLGITPVIVEGRDLEYPENNVWHDGEE